MAKATDEQNKFIELRARLLAHGIMINVSAIWRWITKKKREKKR